MNLADLKSKTIIYIDNFKHGNISSNSHTLKIFKKYYKKVIPIHVRWINPLQMKLLIWMHKPDQIHYGGSVKKTSLVPLSTYKMVQEKYPAILQSVLYGDLYHSDYISERANYVDVTTDSFFDNKSKKSVLWFPVTLHTTILDEFYSEQVKWSEKKYDVVFCGSNKDNRENLLKFLHEQGVNVHVWGSGWENSSFPSFPQCSILDSFKIYKQSKLVLNDIEDDFCRYNGFNKCEKLQNKNYEPPTCHNLNCQHYKPADAYISNRFLIAAYSSSPVITYSNLGIERILTPSKSCVIVTKRTIVATIKSLLNNPEKCNKIGKNAREEIKKFTFEKLMLKFWSFKK